MMTNMMINKILGIFGAKCPSLVAPQAATWGKSS